MRPAMMAIGISPGRSKFATPTTPRANAHMTPLIRVAPPACSNKRLVAGCTLLMRPPNGAAIRLATPFARNSRSISADPQRATSRQDILATSEINDTIVTASNSGMRVGIIDQVSSDVRAASNGNQWVRVPGDGKYQPYLGAESPRL